MKVEHARGCARTDTTLVTVPAEHLSCAQGPGLLGEYFANIDLAGPPALTRIDAQIAFQWTLFSPDPAHLPYDWYSARWTGTLTAPVTGDVQLGIDGNDGYRLYLDGALLIDNWPKVTRRTRLAEVRLEQGRRYDLRLEYHEPVGNAWLRLVWNVGVPPRTDRDLDDAVALAARSDVAVVVVGIEEGEFRDRSSLALPGRQEELIQRVAATGTPTVVVLVGGSAVTMSRWLDQVPAVLAAWYPGQEGGHAVADVLFGDHNPAGRLPITFPVAEGQLPLVYNHLPTGRGDDYADLTGQALFPFGHGLSYTTFRYDDLRIEPATIAPDGHRNRPLHHHQHRRSRRRRGGPTVPARRTRLGRPPDQGVEGVRPHPPGGRGVSRGDLRRFARHARAARAGLETGRGARYGARDDRRVVTEHQVTRTRDRDEQDRRLIA